MTATSWALLAVAAVSAVTNWWAVGARRKPVEYIAKPATLMALIGVALSLSPADGGVRTWFVIALVFSLAGDVFLMLPRDAFVFGLASFLVGHLAYVGGFIAAGLGPGPLLLGVVVVVAALSRLAPPILRALKAKGHDELRVPVMAYMTVISAMVATAFGAGPAVAVAGALLFYGSDALIAWNRFVHPRPWMPVAIIATYHLGQTALVLSLLR